MTKNWKNFTAEKINYSVFFKSKIAIYLASIKNVQAAGEVFIPQKEHLALQNLNFLHFRGSFRPSWIQIRIHSPYADPGPDPADQNECGSRSTTLLFS
jgi:hypothetical protein